MKNLQDLKELIIVDFNRNQFGGGHSKEFTYDKIVDLLIKAQKLKHLNPKKDIACRIDDNLIKDSEIIKIISAIYDTIIDDKYDLSTYNTEYSDCQINDTVFDNDYEYNAVKNKLGPILSNHFMFIERDIEIAQRGGFNFRNNKIKFKKRFDPNMKIVCELYDKPCKSIKHSNVKYYHTDKTHRYHPYPDLNTMFDGVKEYDYLTPIKKLTDYHSDDSYYQKLLNRTSKYLSNLQTSKTRLNTIDEISALDRDSIMLQYAKCRENLFAITLWKPAIPELNKFIELLEQEGEVYYIKTFNLTLNGLRNLMYWYYDEFSHELALNHIEKKLQYIDATPDNNPVCFVLFDNVNKKRLAGQGAPLKKYFRNKLLEFTDLDPQKYRGNDLLHINDYFYQTIEYSQIVLNDNSLKLLDKQNCRVYGQSEFLLSNLKLQTLRNIVYSNMSLLEIDRFIIMGGLTLYAYGVRAFNDVDCIVIDNEPNASHQLEKITEQFFSNKSTKIGFLDGALQGSKFWRDSWVEKDQPIFDFLGIGDYKNLTLDPANFFYFQGLKVVSLDFEMIRKLIRNRTQDHVDFLMMSLLYPEIMSEYIELTNTDQLFIPTIKYKKITGTIDNSFQDLKHKILNRRYTKEQISKVSSNEKFVNFFE